MLCIVLHSRSVAKFFSFVKIVILNQFESLQCKIDTIRGIMRYLCSILTRQHSIELGSISLFKNELVEHVV